MIPEPLILLVNPHPFLHPSLNAYPPICSFSALTSPISSVFVSLLTASLSVPYYVAHTPVSCQLFFLTTTVACRLPPIHIIFTCSTTSSYTKNRLTDFARAARPYIVQRNTGGEAKGNIGKGSFYPEFPSVASSYRYPALRLRSSGSTLEEARKIPNHFGGLFPNRPDPLRGERKSVLKLNASEMVNTASRQ